MRRLPKQGLFALCMINALIAGCASPSLSGLAVEAEKPVAERPVSVTAVPAQPVTVQADPAQPDLVQADPAQSDLVQSDPVQSDPVQSVSAEQPVSGESSAPGVMQQIAADFTGMLVQIKDLEPANTTLLWSDVTRSAGPFADVLKTDLVDSGYGLELSDDRDNDLAVGFFKVEDSHSSDGISGTYIISVGDRQLQRSYRLLSDGVLIANSEMTLRGTDATGIRRHAASMPTLDPAKIKTGEPEPEPQLPEIDTQKQYAGVQNLAAESAANEPFMDLFNVHEAILRFDSESLELSEQSLGLLQILATKLESDTDLVVVAGCAQVESRLENGNAELAVARAQLISKELQKAGVPERNIFEAGCWADEVIDLRFPQHGVVLTLKREVNPS